MKKSHSLFVVLFALLLGTGCGRQRLFEAQCRAFDASANVSELLLGEILDNYRDTVRIAPLHALYLRDGTFAQLDALEERQKELIRLMSLTCPRRRIPRLTGCIERHFNICSQLEAAEVPMLFRGFPLGAKTIRRERLGTWEINKPLEDDQRLIR